jgi:hypothetical protein
MRSLLVTMTGSLVFFLSAMTSAQAWAAGSQDPFSDFSFGPSLAMPAPTSSRQSSYPQGQLSLLIPSFVVHGIQPADDTPNHMPRKLTNNGDMVATPGFGLEFKGDDGDLFLAAVIKDCYNNLAGTFQYGKYFKITRDIDWGFTFGLYARETPIACETTSAAPGFTATHCHAMDSYSWKFLAHFNNEAVDIIPLPFLNFSVNLYRDKDTQIDLKLMGNFILNEVGVSILI